MIRQAFFLPLFLIVGFHLYAQDCTEIPQDKTWAGKTTAGTEGKYGDASGISIEKVSANTYRISDFSAGFISEFGFSEATPYEITLDCDGNIQSSSGMTAFGDVTITGGAWDATNQKVTLNWSYAHYEFSETSEFTIQ